MCKRMSFDEFDKHEDKFKEERNFREVPRNSCSNCDYSRSVNRGAVISSLGCIHPEAARLAEGSETHAFDGKQTVQVWDGHICDLWK